MLLALLKLLAEAGISILAVSTCDIDCVLIKADQVSRAEAALRRPGFGLRMYLKAKLRKCLKFRNLQ